MFPVGEKKSLKQIGGFITSLKTTSFFCSQMINSILQHLMNISLNDIFRVRMGAGEGVGQMDGEVSHEHRARPLQISFHDSLHVQS